MSAVSDEVKPKEAVAAFLENKAAPPQSEVEVDAPETRPSAPTVLPKGQPKPGTYKEEKGFSAEDVKGGPDSAIDRLRGSLSHLSI
jgi:hypothetical protein